jgi:hypothetical protein
MLPAFSWLAYVLSVGSAAAVSASAWKIVASASAGCFAATSAIACSYATTRVRWSRRS